MRSRRDKKRARERDRNKRSRKYGQIKRKHSRKRIWSCVMAVLVTAVIAGLIVMAFMNKGKSAAMVGSFGVFDMILACIGIVTGVKAVSYTHPLINTKIRASKINPFTTIPILQVR